MGQRIDYDVIQSKLDIIKTDGDITKLALDSIDKLIQESVGNGGKAWSGESASAFRASWDALAADLPSYIEVVKNQALNVESMLAKTKASDEASDGSVAA